MTSHKQPCVLRIYPLLTLLLVDSQAGWFIVAFVLKCLPFINLQQRRGKHIDLAHNCYRITQGIKLGYHIGPPSEIVPIQQIFMLFLKIVFKVLCHQQDTTGDGNLLWSQLCGKLSLFKSFEVGINNSLLNTEVPTT